MSKIPAVLSISFRPFFILVAMIAIVNPIAWAFSYAGYFQMNLVNVSSLFWHGHEMIFGFFGAMIAGFILTASANWTGSEPYKGLPLLGLVLVWLLERFSYFLPLGRPSLFVLSNLFFPLLAVMLLLKLINFPKHKYVFIPILLLLMTGKLLNSWGYLFENEAFEVLGRDVATGTLRLIVLLIAGRVIPFFTSKKIGLQLSVPPILNVVSLVSVTLLIVPWEPIFGKSFVAVLLAVAVVGNTCRLFYWRPEKVIKIPILFILHIGVFFIIASLMLKILALYYAQLSFSKAPLHLLMAAGLGTVGVGIMSRVSLGHTGRVIAADSWVCLSYVLVVSGGLIRVLVPLILPSLYLSSLIVSALLWSGGFMIFFIRFWTILTTARPDGRE